MCISAMHRTGAAYHDLGPLDATFEVIKAPFIEKYVFSVSVTFPLRRGWGSFLLASFPQK